MNNQVFLQTHPVDPRFNTLLEALQCMVQYKKSPVELGIIEGWVPAMVYVKVNIATREMKHEFIDIKLPVPVDKGLEN